MTRPNGKLYKPRKSATTILFTDGDPCVLVLRQADRCVAELLARSAARDWDSSALVVSGVFSWWRESIRNGEPEWVTDEVRGAPGWLFQVE